MKLKDKNQFVLDYLKQEYPNPKCELNYNSPFELLVAVILSAQCTDKRVNQVTEILFKKYNSYLELLNNQAEDQS